MSDRRWAGWTFLPVLVCAFLIIPFAGFIPDDLYIYLQFARNLVERGELSFNPGEPVNAVTSPVWLLVLAGARAIGLVPLVAAKVFSSMDALLAVAGVVALVWWTTRRTGLALAGGLLMATDPWHLRWAASGMEGAASAAVVVWTFALRARPSWGWATNLGAALLLALAPLVRPECAVLLLVVLVWEAFESRITRSVRQLALDLLAVALVLLPWAIYAQVTFGDVVPATAVAKGTLGSAFLDAGAALVRVAKVLLTGQGMSLVLIAIGAFAARSWRRGSRASGVSPVWWPVAWWSVALITLYAARHVSVYTRYLLTLSPLLAAAGPAALAPLLDRRPGLRRLAVLAVVLGVGFNLIFTYTIVLPPTRVYAEHMQSANVALARELAETTPADAVVAVPNIGAIGYLSGRRILDLNGLITPDLVRFKRAGRLDRYLRRHPPDYYIDIHADPERALHEPPGLRLTPIRSLPFRHMFLRQSEPLWYSLYKVEGLLTGEGESASE